MRALIPSLAVAIAIAAALCARSAHAHSPGERAARAKAAKDAKDAEDADPETLDVTITDDRAPEAASDVVVTGADLKLRPRSRPADLLQAVPGLFAVQHAGGGKANQYFLRGFDIDHGTDLALYVDGVPVNLPSHGHGQGYADLHFLIPELVTSLEAHKGTYDARPGAPEAMRAVNQDRSHAQRVGRRDGRAQVSVEACTVSPRRLHTTTAPR